MFDLGDVHVNCSRNGLLDFEKVPIFCHVFSGGKYRIADVEPVLTLSVRILTPSFPVSVSFMRTVLFAVEV